MRDEFGYFDCCGMSRARGHADLCWRGPTRERIEAFGRDRDGLDAKHESRAEGLAQPRSGDLS